MDHITNNLAVLIGSRICHDLISPIGAITNGLELMQMSGSALTPEVSLIADSVDHANARIRFFRVAYGLASEKQAMSRAEIIGILKNGALGARVSIIWEPLEEIPRAQVRLVFLALQCFETAMPYGGRITITRQDGRWSLAGSAEKLRQSADLWAGLHEPGRAGDVTPAQVQFALLPQLVRDEGRRITLQASDTDILMRF